MFCAVFVFIAMLEVCFRVVKCHHAYVVKFNMVIDTLTESQVSLCQGQFVVLHLSSIVHISSSDTVGTMALFVRCYINSVAR